MNRNLLAVFIISILVMSSISVVNADDSTSNPTKNRSENSLDYYFDQGMERNIFFTHSENRDLESWKLSEQWPSYIGSNNMNQANLNSSFSSPASAMTFDFPYEAYPLSGLTANYEPGVTPFVNLTINTNYVNDKLVNFEIRFDANDDGIFETDAMFDPYTTQNDPMEWNEEHIRASFTGYSNGPPGNMRNGTVQLAFWRTDNIEDDPGTGIDEDWLTIYCGAYGKYSWVLLPYKWAPINPVPVIKPDNYEDPENWWLDPPDDPLSPHYKGYLTNNSLTMDASKSYSPLGLALDYYWTFGDGDDDDLETVEHTYRKSGSYYIQLWATDSSGRQGYTDKWVMVSDNPPEDNEPPTLISDNSPDEGAIKDDFKFDIVADDNIGIKTVEVTWNHKAAGDEFLLDKLDGHWFGTITLGPDTADLTYTITIVDRSDNSFTSSERTVNVVDNDPPDLLEERTPNVCQTGGKLNFSIDVTDTNDIESVYVKYTTDLKNYSQENFNQITDVTWVASVFVSVDAISLHYYYIIEDTLGNVLNTSSTIGEINVTVVDVIEPTAISPEDVSIEQDETLILNASGSTDNLGIVCYSWTFTYGEVKQELNDMVTVFKFDEPGVYNITLEVTDEEGNRGIDCFIVTVMDTSPPAAIIGRIRDEDEGSLITFDGAQSSDNVGIINYTWTFQYNGTVQSLYDITPSFLFDIPGIYNVTLLVKDNWSNTDSNNVIFTIRDITEPIVNISFMDGFVQDDDRLVIHKGKKVDLDASNSIDNVGIENWTWKIRSKYGTVELFNPKESYVFDEVGIYTITLTITDTELNSNKISFKLDVKEPSAPTSGEKGESIFPIWLIISIIIIVVVGITIGVVLFTRSNTKKRKKDMPPRESTEPAQVLVPVKDYPPTPAENVRVLKGVPVVKVTPARTLRPPPEINEIPVVKGQSANISDEVQIDHSKPDEDWELEGWEV